MIPTLAAAAPHHHQAGSFEHAEVFHDGEARGGKLLGQGAGGLGRLTQQVQDGAARRVGQRVPQGNQGAILAGLFPRFAPALICDSMVTYKIGLVKFR